MGGCLSCPLCRAPVRVRPLRFKRRFYPALQRKYGEISGPYVVQADQCKCIGKGVDLFNAEMGFQAIRLIFRRGDAEDPKARGREQGHGSA